MNKVFKRFSDFRIFIEMLPFLCLYIALIKYWILPSNLAGDEGRYLKLAQNLISGYYSSPFPNINLWNGPGYPIFIAPFVGLDFSYEAIRMLNAFLLYFSLVVIYKAICIYDTRKVALISVILLGSFFPAFQMLRFIHTETLSWFLISLICLSVIKYYKSIPVPKKYLMLSAFLLAYLAMVKVLFGYAIVSLIIISIIVYFVPGYRYSACKALLLFSLSFIFCLPYLVYTHKLTDKVFYWTNSGGMSLYTMSTPHPDEFGDWSNTDVLQLNPNHSQFMDSIANLTPLERDDAYKKAAIENIASHPGKYAINYVANIGRLFFEFPLINRKDDVNRLFYIFPTMFIIASIFLALFIFILYFKFIPFEIVVLLLFFLAYLFGSSLLSAYSRMFQITLPFWALFISFVFSKFITVKVKNS